MRFLASFLTLICIILLPVRSSEAGPGQRLADYCIGEVRAPGSYLVTAKGRIAEVTPVKSSGATQDGAEALNNCIAARAAATLPGYATARKRYIPVQEQRKAILQCRKKFGFGGRVKFGASWSEIPQSRQTYLWILPHRTLTPEYADRINACADRVLNRPQSPRIGDSYAISASPVGPCPKHAAVLYGGTRYCIGN